MYVHYFDKKLISWKTNRADGSVMSMSHLTFHPPFVLFTSFLSYFRYSFCAHISPDPFYDAVDFFFKVSCNDSVSGDTTLTGRS